jgi:hypothetical protein
VLPWDKEWNCIDKISANVKLIMQIDLCCKVLKLIPSFHNKTAREVEDYLCKSHAPDVVRSIGIALDQVHQGCTGIMGMLTSCGHALVKILSYLIVHVVLARLRGGYNCPSRSCFKNYSSTFNQATSPSTQGVISDFISGKISILQSMISTSSGENYLHLVDAVVHLDELASRLCPSSLLAPLNIPTIAAPSTADKIPPSKLRSREVFVTIRYPLRISTTWISLSVMRKPMQQPILSFFL